MVMDSNYSLENAQQFKWSSISGDLNPERAAHLQKYLVGHKLLDAGCGGGGYVDFLSKQGFDVTGVDKYDEFLAVAREQNRQGHFVEGDLTALDFPDNSFDCSYCFDVLEHIDDAAALAELARVTKRRLIIAVPKADEFFERYNLTFAHYRDKTHLRYYSEEMLRAKAEAIAPANVLIFPELVINTEGLVREFIDFAATKGMWRRQSSRSFVHEMLKDATYQKIYTGLVAIIDLN